MKSFAIALLFSVSFLVCGIDLIFVTVSFRERYKTKLKLEILRFENKKEEIYQSVLKLEQVFVGF